MRTSFLSVFLLLLSWRASAGLWERDPLDPVALDILPWTNTDCSSGIDFCGILEFCAADSTHWAFRLPNKPCLPGRGPTIRMRPGKKYQLTLSNNATVGIARHATTLHTHGLHIAVDGNADNVTRVVEAGKCAKYTWAIPANHMGGTFLYYSMLHRSSEAHVNGGAFGALIIEDDASLAPTLEVREWMQNELLLLGAKLELESNIKSLHDIRLGHGYYWVPLHITANSWYRVRVVGAQLGGRPEQIVFGEEGQCQVHAVAYDGVWGLNVPINMAPRRHYDMILHMDVALNCLPGEHNISFFGGSVYTLIASDATPPSTGTPFVVGVDSLPTSWSILGKLPGYLQDLRDIPADQVASRFSFEMQDGYINSKAWDPTTPFVTFNVGDVVEWSLNSTTSGPFHLQGYPMQVVTPGGCGWHKEGHWYSVISAVEEHTEVLAEEPETLVHPPEPSGGSECTIRFRARDFGGRVVMRSQYLEIGDWGTMGWVQVNGGPPADMTDIAPFRCIDGKNCDISCKAQYQCNSVVGRDNCNLPCTLSKPPQCPATRPFCNTLQNICTAANQNPQRNALPKVVPPPTTLLTLKWNSTGCAPSYDFCGDLEFCAIGLTQFAFRLPGKPCLPAHSPILRMAPGKKYQLWLHNKGELRYHQHITNLHTHGIHVSGDGNADDVTRVVKPFDVLKYTWDIPADHLGGTFWYHCHVHELTRLAVTGGAFGMLIIDDPPFFAPTPEFQLYLDNEVPLIASKVGNTFLGNGNKQEPLYLKAREWYRLRIVGVDPEVKPKDIVIADQNCDCHRMQHDGVWNTVIPANVVPRNVWTMTGASRIEVAIRCKNAGTYNIRWFGGVVARLIVSGTGVPSLANPWPRGQGLQWDTASKRPPYLQDLTTYKGLVIPWTFTVRHGFINDLAFDAAVPHRDFPYGAVVEWTLRGTAGHAFHLHIWHMQVVTPGGCGFHEYGQWYDVISASDGGDCKVRFQMRDLGGRTIFHCHYLEHEDMGTMGWVNVTGDHPPIDYFDVEPVRSQPWCTWDGTTCTPYDECGTTAGYDNCGNDCVVPAGSTCAIGTICSELTKKCVPDPYRSGLPTMYSPEVEARWGYSIGRLGQLSALETPELQALVLRTKETERGDYAEGFHSHVYVMRSKMMPTVLPVSAVDTTMFDAVVTSWGSHRVVRAVVTSFIPSNVTLDKLGITRNIGPFPPVLLLQVDRLTADGQFANEDPMELQVRLPADVPLAVYVHTLDRPNGVPLAAEGGSVRAGAEPRTFVITVPHTSLISVLAPVEVLEVRAKTSTGNVAMWGSMAAVGLVAFLGGLWVVCCVTRARKLQLQEYAIMELEVASHDKPIPPSTLSSQTPGLPLFSPDALSTGRQNTPMPPSLHSPGPLTPAGPMAV